MNTRNLGRRKIVAVMAGILVLAITIGGTYAWHNYRQHKTNDADADATFYKARLVEKYDPTSTTNWKITDPAITKEIRIKNPGAETPDDDRIYGDVYARIQLKEFMEFYPVIQEYTEHKYMIKANTGEPDDGAFYAFDSKADADAFELSVRTTYNTPVHVVEQVRMYNTPASVMQADLKWFIRSAQGDPNGVYGDLIVTQQTVDRSAAGANSLVTGVPNARTSQTTSHNADIGSADGLGSTNTGNGECNYTSHRWVDGLYEWDLAAAGFPVRMSGENFFNYVQWIYGDSVILASEWDGVAVKKWIVDDSATNTSGWVYWGYYISPGESTSNLLEQFQLVAQPDDAFYYAMHVEMEAVSYNELWRWNQTNDVSGSDPIIAALQNAGMKVTAMTLNPSSLEAVYYGETQQFQASVLGTVGVPQGVTWTLTGSDGGSVLDSTGKLTVGANEGSTTLTVTATSTVDPTKSVSITVRAEERPVAATVAVTANGPLTLPRRGVRTFAAAVTGTANVSPEVVWSISGQTPGSGTTITPHGVLTIGPTEDIGAIITVTATSVTPGADGITFVTDTKTVTVTAS